MDRCSSHILVRNWRPSSPEKCDSIAQPSAADMWLTGSADASGRFSWVERGGCANETTSVNALISHRMEGAIVRWTYDSYTGDYDKLAWSATPIMGVRIWA
jgi:hypothetical protein